MPHVYTDDLDPVLVRHPVEIVGRIDRASVFKEINDGSLFDVGQNTAVVVKQVGLVNSEKAGRDRTVASLPVGSILRENNSEVDSSRPISLAIRVNVSRRTRFSICSISLLVARCFSCMSGKGSKKVELQSRHFMRRRLMCNPTRCRTSGHL